MPLPSGYRWLRPHAPLLAGVALVIASGASLIWQTLDWRTLLQADPATDITQTRAPAEQLALDRLVPLFGPSPAGSSGDTPSTHLNLVLHGSFVHADPAKSSAIIQRSGEKPSRFLNGAQLDDNTRLHAVYRDRVELERNGSLERLSFPKRTQNSTSSSHDQAADPAQFNGTDAVDNELLQQRMDALREQMEAATELDALTTEQPPEGD